MMSLVYTRLHPAEDSQEGSSTAPGTDLKNEFLDFIFLSSVVSYYKKTN